MNIERSKFLLLVGSISAAAGVSAASASCTTTNTTNNDGGGVPSLDSGNGTSGGPSTGDAGNNTGDDDGGNDAGACLGDAVDAGPDGDAGACGQTGLVCDSICDTVTTNFKAGIAQDIRSCLAALATCEAGGDAVAGCIETSVAKACADTSATTTCTPLVTACNPDAGARATDGGATFDQATCEAVVRALSTDGRSQFVTCVTEGVSGSCVADPLFCVNQIKMRP